MNLVEISVPAQILRDFAHETMPLMASDLGCAIKGWLASRPAIAPRPWRLVEQRDHLRIVGWRAQAPSPHSLPKDIRLGVLDFATEPGQSLRLRGIVVPLRTIGRKSGIDPHHGDFVERARRQFDAAEGRDDPKEAYEAWLQERLVEVMPFADVAQIEALSWRQDRVLRKAAAGGIRVVSAWRMPVLEAEVTLTVRDPAGVEAWLLRGVGRQKAFGFGGFIPC